MNVTDVDASKIRFNFGELLDRVNYTGAQFRINRRKRPVARLVREPLMQAFEKLLEDDPALADTVALMLNDEVRGEIMKSVREADQGKTRPADEFFDELLSSDNKKVREIRSQTSSTGRGTPKAGDL